jgi:hypothetical protein
MLSTQRMIDPPASRRAGAPRGWTARAVLAALLILTPACGGKPPAPPPPAPPKIFSGPIFDGLALGMSRAAVARLHPIRPARISTGRSRTVAIYASAKRYAVELTFAEPGESARLERIDVHFGASDATSGAMIARFEAILGAPDVRRRKAVINAYGDTRHEQYDTIWSDSTQYVFLTERVPARQGSRPVYFLTVKKKELKAAGPPTGYVPPPPPKDENGKPIDEEPF